MAIRTDSQLEVSRAKLGFLQGACISLRHQPSDDPSVDAMTLQSLESQIKELEREIASYKSSTCQYRVVHLK